MTDRRYDPVSMFVFDPDGLESFAKPLIGGRRGQVVALGPAATLGGSPFVWVQWFGPHREPTWLSFEPIDPTWRFYPDRDSWLNATTHLDHDNRPIGDVTTA